MKRNCKQVCIIATALLMSININAQVTIGGNVPPDKFSLLDLVTMSEKKGLHLPRLTTAERDVLVTDQSNETDRNLAKGLKIYNLDINCEQSFNGTVWIDICGDVVPTITINCEFARVYGKYLKNIQLDESNFITLPILVSKVGDYNIIAKTTNGYSFQAQGTFTEIGERTIKLIGQGMPANLRPVGSEDILVFTNDNEVISPECEVKIKVDAAGLSYTPDCTGVETTGEYYSKIGVDGTTNYVTIPVRVEYEGLAVISSTSVNGLKFIGQKQLDHLTTPSDVIVLQAIGTPQNAGDYTFTVTTNSSKPATCTFTIHVISTLGKYENPACRCLDIKGEQDNAPDGEYWLKDCVTNGMPIKTYCDMTNGGYTLLWSYSEYTARNTYAPTGNMEVQSSTYNMFASQPINVIYYDTENAQTAAINYENFRLPKTYWQNLRNGAMPRMKVRIATNKTDMNDLWGNNNFCIIEPATAAQNPLLYSFDANGTVPYEGKVFGCTFKHTGPAITNTTFTNSDGTSLTAGYWYFYSTAVYSTQFTPENTAGGTIKVVPALGTTNEQNAAYLQNLFGWFSQTMPNHHFGKCSSAAANDYDFGTTATTRQCASTSLYPHSFNPVGGINQGRYCQWFVK